ncbi:cytochrome c-type biogenesis protein CcmH [Polynucleobacter sp. IMCC30063]|uniref:cytochrome c-type biogenesis protein n=1 Tax=unclassified Polynucleobacter TaxID=2640945 RepID=UPI001F3AC01D|nr:MULTISPECIES: cytochrome c-type biogenesis protein [unclassified Polynucleobacter]MCE7506299.1 cytochrome c-type biogenesis protein CcmH [Polynucleobacter sp. IMCC30063]MCE7527579.1 cytochrome c-type biogenesis protein CcmH [Polynucleobacter sp. IMCC 30228]MCE7529397.1 cytochrome c-type biogenesis protein CcmH [Polynucleobacter sp. IMCC 29146]
MRKVISVALLIYAWQVSCLAQAPSAAQPLSTNPALEAQVNIIANELRCLVCQNQTIADSHADLAVDLKNQIRTQLTQGRTQTEILDYMVQRYGDFVLYKPPLKASTWFLWLGPFAILLLAFFFLWRQIQVRKKLLGEQQFSAADLARAKALLNNGTQNNLAQPKDQA